MTCFRVCCLSLAWGALAATESIGTGLTTEAPKLPPTGPQGFLHRNTTEDSVHPVDTSLEASAEWPTFGTRHRYKIQAPTSSSAWAWDVVRVKFLDSHGREISPSTPGCQPLDSGHADVPGYSPLNAFKDDQTWWGGRKDAASNKFFIGIECNQVQDIAAVQLQQGTSSSLHRGHFVESASVFVNGYFVTTRQVTASSGLQTLWAGALGARVQAKNLNTGWAWDVRRLKFTIMAAEWAGVRSFELNPWDAAAPFPCQAVESGHVDVPGYEAKNAFVDGASWWGGREGAGGKFFIGVQCSRPFAWPPSQLYFDQLSEHHASQVELQKLTVFGWTTMRTIEVGSGGEYFGL